jgi:valyl-tRNA synthetase
MAAWVLDSILHILHPMMPYITEELWEKIAPRERMLVEEDWPELSGLSTPDAAVEMDWVVSLVTAVRSVRAEMNVPPGAKIPLKLRGANAETLARLKTHEPLILTLARLESVEPTEGEPGKGSAQVVLGETTLVLPLEGVIDLDQERQRLEKELKRLDDEVSRIDKKLSNQGFLAKAPEEVVEEQKERRADYEGQRDKVREALTRVS